MRLLELTQHTKSKEDIQSFISSFFPHSVDLVYRDLKDVYSYAFMNDNVPLLDVLKNHPSLFTPENKEKTIEIYKSVHVDECLNAIDYSSVKCFEYLTKNVKDTQRWQSFFVALSQSSSTDYSKKLFTIIQSNLHQLNSDIYLNKSIVENLVIHNHLEILKSIDEKKLYPIIKKNIHGLLISSLNPFLNNTKAYQFIKNEFSNELSSSEINEFLNHLFDKHNKELFILNSDILKDFLFIPHIKLHKKTIDNFYSLFKNAPNNPEYIDMYQLVSKHSLKNNIVDKFKSLHTSLTIRPKKSVKI